MTRIYQELKLIDDPDVTFYMMFNLLKLGMVGWFNWGKIKVLNEKLCRKVS
jgi:hypothetical protein